jgi:hypothetical protein
MADVNSLAVVLGSSGAVGALLTGASLVVTWARDHDTAARYARELTSITARVTFWKTWLEAQVVAGVSEDELNRAKRVGYEELNHLAYAMSVLLVAQATREIVKEKEPWSIKRLLLLYPPPKSRRFQIYLLRLYYYYFLLALLSLPVAILAGNYNIIRVLVRWSPVLRGLPPLPVALFVLAALALTAAGLRSLIVYQEGKSR